MQAKYGTRDPDRASKSIAEPTSVRMQLCVSKPLQVYRWLHIGQYAIQEHASAFMNVASLSLPLREFAMHEAHKT